MYPSIRPFLYHVDTLGMSQFYMMRPGVEPAWVQFFSDPTYMPHLRSVLTDMATHLLDLSVQFRRPFLEDLRSFEEELEDRGVAFKGLADDHTLFIPIKLLQRDTREVSISCSVIDRCSFPCQHQSALPESVVST